MKYGKIDYKTITLDELLEMDGDEPAEMFDSVIIVPIPGELHDSGFKRMKYVFVRGYEVVGVSGCGDVLHLDGIGGYGKHFDKALRSGKVDVVGWRIDCLPVCGCCRVFSDMLCESKGCGFSDAEIVSSGMTRKEW